MKEPDASVTPGADGPAFSPSTTGPRDGDDTATEILPFRQLGHYEIQARIGRGGMGDVYRGFEASLNRNVAIKVLPAEFARSPEQVRRFSAEAAATAALNHPNVVSIHFVGEDRGVHFFAMEFVSGPTLSDLIKQKGRLSVGESVDLMIQILRGLQSAHEAGIIHRDIKPANVLLDSRCRHAKLADFGLVKSLAADAGLTATGVVMGTAEYMSPEQGAGTTVDARSDLYATGVLLFRMLAGRLPFQADSATGLIFKHCYDAPPPVEQFCPGIPRALATTVHRLLEKSPAARYQDCGDVIRDLVAVQRSLDSSRDSERFEGLVEAAAAAAPRPSFVTVARLRFWAWLNRTAPALSSRLQETSQQLDQAVALYESRRGELSALVAESDAAVKSLREQADVQRQAENQSPAEIDDAADLERQADQQEHELATIRLRLADVSARLDQLYSQRSALQARQSAADARLLASGGRRRKRWSLRRITTLTVPVVVVVIVVLISLPNNGPATPTTAGPANPVSENTSSTPTSAARSSLERFSDGRPRQEAYRQASPVADGSGYSVLLGPSASSLVTDPLAAAGQDTPFVVGDVQGGINVFRFDRTGSFRHTGRIEAQRDSLRDLVLSARAELAATVSDDVLHIWDLDRLREYRRRAIQRVEGICFNPSGTMVAFKERNTIRIWDLTQDIIASELPAPGIHSLLDWSADEQLFLCGGSRPQIMSRSGDVTPLTLHQASYHQCEAGRFLAGGGEVATVDHRWLRIHDVASGAGATVLNDPVTAPVFGDTGLRMVSKEASDVLVWNVRTGSTELRLSHPETSFWLCSLTDHGRLAITIAGNELRTWLLPPPPEPPGLLARIPCMSSYSLRFLPDGVTVAIGEEKRLRVVSLLEGTGEHEYQCEGTIDSLSCRNDASLLLTRNRTAADGEVSLYSLRLGLGRPHMEELRQLAGHEGRVNQAIFLPRQYRALTAGDDRTVRLWALTSELEVSGAELDYPVHSICVHSDENRVAAGLVNGQIVLLTLPDLNVIERFPVHRGAVTGVAFLGSENAVVSCGVDGVLRITDASSGELQAEVSPGERALAALAVSNTGRWIAAGAGSGAVVVVDRSADNAIHVLRGHSLPVVALDFSPNDASLISAAREQNALLWSTESP